MLNQNVIKVLTCSLVFYYLFTACFLSVMLDEGARSKEVDSLKSAAGHMEVEVLLAETQFLVEHNAPW